MSAAADDSKKNDYSTEPAQAPARDKKSSVGANGTQQNGNQLDELMDNAVAAIQGDCVDMIPKPLDGGYAWVVCIAAMSLNFILDGIGYAFSIFIPSFQEAFHGASKSQVAWIGALLGGVYMLSGPVASALVNKFGCRLVTMTGALFTTAAFLFASQCDGLIGMVITFGVLGGFGFGLIYLPSIVCVGHYFEKKRALATGLTVCGSGIGMFVFAPLSEFLLSEFDLRNSIVWLASIVLQCVWLGALLVPLEKKQRRIRQSARKLASRAACTDRELPRAKNAFDRIRERVCSWCSRSKSEDAYSASSASDLSGADAPAGANEEMMAALQKVKEERQARADADSVHASTRHSISKRHDSITNADGAVIGGFDAPEAEADAAAADNGETPTVAVAVMADDDTVSATNVSQKSTPAKRTPTLSATGAGSLDRNRANRVRSSAGASYGSNLRVPSGAEKAASGRDRKASNGQRDSDVALRSTLECLTSLSHLQRVYDAQKASPSVKLHKDVARPLYRQDIFYSGSIVNIDKYQRVEQVREQRPEAVPAHAYTASVICIPLADGAAGDQPDGDPERQVDRAQISRLASAKPCERTHCGCLRLLPKPVADVLAEMLNFSLLRVPAFSLILVGNLFAMFGFIIPFMYLVDLARGMEREGVPSPPAALLLTFTGIANTIGRVLCGWISSQPSVDGLLLHNVTLTIAGLLTAIVPLLQSYTALAIYAVAYGFFISPFICLTSVILCDVVGVEALTNSFGLLCLVRGAVTIASSPFAGFLYDVTKSYTYSFLLSSGTIFIGAACHYLLFLPVFQTERMKQQIATRRGLVAAAKQRKRSRARNSAVKYTPRRTSSSDSAIEVYHEEAEPNDGAHRKTSEVTRSDRAPPAGGYQVSDSSKLLSIQEEHGVNNHKPVTA